MSKELVKFQAKKLKSVPKIEIFEGKSNKELSVQRSLLNVNSMSIYIYIYIHIYIYIYISQQKELS